MCTPVLIASAALAVGSTVANTVAANQQAQARNDVLAAERIRQGGFNQEAAALNTQSQDSFVDFVPQMEAQRGQLGDVLASRVAPDPNTSTGTIMPSSSSSVVNQERDKQLTQAQGYVDQQAGAMADMRSFGDLLGELSIGQARNASKIGQIGGFKQASNNIMPLELNEASKAGDGAMLLGDILGGLSGIGTSIGTGGAPTDWWNKSVIPAQKTWAGPSWRAPNLAVT
jgi:hypothetical protein